MLGVGYLARYPSRTRHYSALLLASRSLAPVIVENALYLIPNGHPYRGTHGNLTP